MRSLEETYIVRVRSAEGDAVVEDVRSRRRVHVEKLSDIGELIAEWLGRTKPVRSSRTRVVFPDAREAPRGQPCAETRMSDQEEGR